ncbi:siderophore-interacting protein [Actinomadura rudentiformis]|uniref:Siderophore-interacting protein n=1 Tax=Actinomadura rudentiformis TaxID=359158 RepID=A0A6H9YWX4_9ACTN|nr:siderophore-interacting protein [Actinomadura rudentiformis]KAB2345531.1 siderophore-interacting protein [Actinomadura rudentiformis]
MAAGAAPFRFFDLSVVRTERLTPNMMRVVLGADDDFVSGGRDQRFKLFLPHPGQDVPVVPRSEDWFAEWRALDPGVRGVMRTYTVRSRHEGEVVVDFALHGGGRGDGGGDGGGDGPASRWAVTARPGDRLVVLGPTVPDNGGVEFEPPAGTDWFLLAGDATALPAIGGILDWLPAGARAKVWIEVPHPDDRQDLPTMADAEIVWLPAGGLLDAIRNADLPEEGIPYAWIAGEAGTIRALRRHLVNERGYDRKHVEFMGYWRRGSDEEQLLAEALTGQDPHTAED